MYIPKSFNIDDWSIIEEAIRDWSFVDLIGVLDGDVIISKNPIIYKSYKEFNFHLANGNPLLKVIGESRKVEMLISGPHNYISPKWSVAMPAVPTWNYIAIQISLECKIINDAHWLISHHNDLFNKYEQHGWKNDIPSEFRNKLNGMICGVSGNVIKYQAKYKLGQNFSNEDYTGIYKGLLSDNANNELAKVMIKLFPNKIIL